jgi:hypothetical protein
LAFGKLQQGEASVLQHVPEPEQVPQEPPLSQQ